MVKILMVEDDAELAQILTQYLGQFNISLKNFEDPFLALSALALDRYDLVILDLTLPGMDGLEVCREIVQKYDIPIIISSARSDIADKVIALELGADDYLPKPYDPRELEVRIKTILRRFSKSLESKNNRSKEIFTLNEEKKEITKNSIPLKFTHAEYEIMALFCKNKAAIISRYDILESMDISSDGTAGSIAVLINRIRSKIEDNPKSPKYLLTIRGMGYKLVE